MTDRKYYKVLLDGKSFHGGNLEWSLPKKRNDELSYEPGDWMSVEGPVEICVTGLHLTSDPKRWFAHKADVYEVEIGDGERSDHFESDEKIAVEKCRLVRPLTRGELRDLDIFVVMYGEDVQTDKGLVFADGNATVRADGNARVEAYGNARVEAYGNARVEAYGNATVRADGNARVEADGNARVEAYGNARVEAYGNATVRAYGNARVEADGNATVNQVTLYHWQEKNTSTVTLAGNAVNIDRRGDKPVITVATPATEGVDV